VTKPSIVERAAWWLIVSAVVIVPLFVSLRGNETFRTPKDSLFLAFGLVAGVFVIARGIKPRRTAPLLALAALAWTVIATIASENRTISIRTLVWVAAAAAFVIAVDTFGRKRSPLVIAFPLIPAAINALLFLLQRFHLWNPMRFPDSVPDQFRFTALIGNPDDVGSFLVAPAVIAVALVLSDRGRRALWTPLSILLVAALLTGRVTPVLALGAAMLTIGFLRSRRGGIIATAAVIVIGIVLVTGYGPLRERAESIMSNVRAHDYASATSGRITPSLAAAEMAKQHPLFGVGPGCFGFEYFPYKLAVEQAHPHLRKAYSSSFSYGETHDDYLQTLAETGIVGLAILLAAIVVLARSSRRTEVDDDEEPSLRDEIRRTTALPLAVGVAVLCLAHFPLHLAASTIVLLYAGTLCVAWADPAAEPRTITQPWLRYAGAGAAAIAALLLIQHFAWSHFTCNERKSGLIAATRDVVEVIVDRGRAANLAHDNLAAIDGCLTADPTDVDFYMLAAANQHALGRDGEAVAMYRSALSWERRPEIYYSVGMLELRMNRRAEAMADLRSAAEFNRSFIDDLPPQVRDEINASLR